ncbi:HlyD family efflux transporter periplasmic adaptor subunit [Cupriavidus basilensis]|uniref:HlyD family efflux transporter periplasmic adaptor subunit n=1 Tax=Cupriavidus basilensis TaxID=68895 RepID=A0ABT6AY05_9BURK|nr:HlyD family efflux transporter periplasmic adaptor subunit [Cupriavidus basilensis]MDF3837505.1 HlyD family efflux transporter periplasmic adaptor subunit [Cupriavidus basilensis]
MLKTGSTKLPRGGSARGKACWLVAAALWLGACGRVGPGAETRTPLQSGAPADVLASAKGRVDIAGGLVRLAARRDGVISRVMVEEGDRVRAGQLLATLDAEVALRGLALARAEVRQAEQERSKARIELAAAARERKRLQPLAEDDTVARQDLDLASDRHAFATVALLAADAAFATAQARHAIAEREVEERRVTAPLDGQIIQRQARPGNGVSTLNVTPLFLFAPDGARIVRAELEEQYLPGIKAGGAAQIILDADPARRWSGKVLRVGRIVGQRSAGDDPAEKQDNRVVEVVVALDAQDLLIGQRVVVRFLAK